MTLRWHVMSALVVFPLPLWSLLQHTHSFKSTECTTGGHVHMMHYATCFSTRTFFFYSRSGVSTFYMQNVPHELNANCCVSISTGIGQTPNIARNNWQRKNPKQKGNSRKISSRGIFQEFQLMRLTQLNGNARKMAIVLCRN